MIKTNFEPYCNDCPHMVVVDDETKIYGFDERGYAAHHVITCKFADICRRVTEKIRKEVDG